MKDNETAAELQARIASLEAKNSVLEARLAALEPKPKPPQRPDEPAVRIMQTAAPSQFTMPSERELRALYQLGCGLAKVLAPADGDEREHFASFAAAFKYLSSVSRSDRLDTSRMCSWWCGEARQWLHERGNSVDVKPVHLTLAALCHGDIPHSFDPARWPFDLALGLALGTMKLPTGAGWLQVIETSRFRAATALPELRDEGPRHIRPRDVPPGYIGPLW